MNYKLLDTEFVKHQFRFRQIRREGDVAIFHKVALKGNLHPAEFDGGFETVVISRHDGYSIGGATVEPAECYPSSEQWGTKGWTYNNLLAAEKRFDKLCGKTPEQLETPLDIISEEDSSSPASNTSTSQLNIPDKEFTTKELAEYNKVDYPVAFLWLKANVGQRVQMSGERKIPGVRGKPAKTYVKI